MDIYISGRISGNPQHEQEFRKAALELSMAGHKAVVPQDIPPHEHDGPCPASYASAPGGHSAACYLRTDLSFMLTCDAIYLLRGWEKSVGARLEFSVAAMCGLTILYQEASELYKRLAVANIVNPGPPVELHVGPIAERYRDTHLSGPPVFEGDASQLHRRRYEGDE